MTQQLIEASQRIQKRWMHMNNWHTFYAKQWETEPLAEMVHSRRKPLKCISGPAGYWSYQKSFDRTYQCISFMGRKTLSSCSQGLICDWCCWWHDVATLRIVRLFRNPPSGTRGTLSCNIDTHRVIAFSKAAGSSDNKRYIQKWGIPSPIPPVVIVQPWKHNMTIRLHQWISKVPLSTAQLCRQRLEAVGLRWTHVNQVFRFAYWGDWTSINHHKSRS